jgi:hypothetical protein
MGSALPVNVKEGRQGGDTESVGQEGKPSQGVWRFEEGCRIGPHFTSVEGRVERERETKRTSGSDVGCNKPTGRSVEKTVEVVRDHEDGTSNAFCNAEPKEATSFDTASGSGHRQEKRRRGTRHVGGRSGLG